MLDLHFTSLRAEIFHNGFEVLWFGAFEPSKGLLFIEGSPVLHKIFDQTIFTALLGPNSPKRGCFPGMDQGLLEISKIHLTNASNNKDYTNLKQCSYPTGLDSEF